VSATSSEWRRNLRSADLKSATVTQQSTVRKLVTDGTAALADGTFSNTEIQQLLSKYRGASEEFENARARLRKEFNTTLARFDLLAQLARKPAGATMSEVSELLMVSNGAITALVQKLEADGFIHREVDSDDRRTFRLRLSQEGAKEFGRMARRHEEWVIALIGELSPVAQSDLLQHLTLLKRRLDKHS